MEKKWYPNGWYFDEVKGKWIAPDYQAEHDEVSPTGWVYDRDTMMWNPPPELIEESKRKWRWDSDRQIWVDIEKEARLQRYYAYRKSQGKEPTYEEWKAAREAEKNKDKSTD